MRWHRGRANDIPLSPDGPATLYPSRSRAWLHADHHVTGVEDVRGTDSLATDIDRDSDDVWREPTRLLTPLRVPRWLDLTGDDKEHDAPYSEKESSR